MQIRTILNLEALLAEAQSIFAAASTEEGFKGLQESKIIGMMNRLASKIDTQDKVDQLTAINQTRDGEVIIDLHVKGEQALQEAVAGKEKLSMLQDALSSFKKDDDSLEATSPYLVRAHADAARSGLQLPALILHEAIRRQCFSMLISGNIASALATLDPGAGYGPMNHTDTHALAGCPSPSHSEFPGPLDPTTHPRTPTLPRGSLPSPNIPGFPSSEFHLPENPRSWVLVFLWS